MKTTRDFFEGERSSKRRRIGEKQDNNDVSLAGLQALPDELLVMIFERLASKADLQSINRTCQQFANLLENPYLWYRLNWPEKDYGRWSETIDAVIDRKEIYVLGNDDIAVVLENGEFELLPVMQREWRHFQGHIDTDLYYFHTSHPIKHIIAMQYNLLATCAVDGICIWNRLTGELVRHLPLEHANDKPFQLLYTSNNSLVSASSNGNIYLYQDNALPAIPFEKPDMQNMGELKRLAWSNGSIVGEYTRAIVSWNHKGRLATIRVVIDDLQSQLLTQIETILADKKIMSSGLILPIDVIGFNNPRSKELLFEWNFIFPDNRIEVVLNKTFSFVIDLFGGKQPIFLGVHYRNCVSHDGKRNYFMLRELAGLRYEALFNWSSQEGAFKSKVELAIQELVKSYFMQPTGVSIFVLYDGSAVVWDVLKNESRQITLAIPDVPPDYREIFEYGDDDWKFYLILTNEIMAIHALGTIIIWDIHTGSIKQCFAKAYLCDESIAPTALQMGNGDILVECLDEGVMDENGDQVNKKKHVCRYRFLQPPPSPPVSDDAMSVDSDIMSPTL